MVFKMCTVDNFIYGDTIRSVYTVAAFFTNLLGEGYEINRFKSCSGIDKKAAK
jgi:hypothetical protein